jgi:hypothetical protein
VTGGAVAVPVLGLQSAEAQDNHARRARPITVTPEDPRYPGLVSGSNQRWVGTPDCVRIVRSADQALWTVQEAVDSGRRITVRSGGHCNEDFTTSGSRVLIDMSVMDNMYYDEERQAFAVESGATLGGVYRSLYKGWGVTIPGGTCPTVGIGGHIAGGGYGPLSRLHGLSVDHLYAVELVVVDRSGRARTVVATRDRLDPNRELWWAHTGAGGGNFGVVTRYWLRSRNTVGAAPDRQLPRPPSELIVSDVSWSWADLDERSFTQLLRNYSRWYVRNSGQDSLYTGLFSQLKPQHRSAGAFSMSTQIDASLPEADKLLDDFLDAVSSETGVSYRVNDRSRVSWLYAVKEWFGFVTAATARWKAKSAYLRSELSDTQLRAFYKHMTRTDYVNPSALVVLAGYGGRINAVAPSDTAIAQRDSIIKMLYVSLWTNPAEDDKHQRWVREFYRDVYADSGGVPTIGGVDDGCYINYADADLADPALNTSGVPWHQLYFKDGYRRLQRVKAQWDPGNVFTHALAVRA